MKKDIVDNSRLSAGRMGKMLSGAATLTFYHRTSDLSNKIKGGSIGGDWRIVGGDLRSSINAAKIDMKAG
jgi:hypothetical protein